jgi:hypothetical protein
MSETTTTRNFRENLKHFFDLAKKSPISVNRGSERFIIMSENEFLKMKEEVMNLQKSLISNLQQQSNQTAPAIDPDENEEDDELLKEYTAKYKNRKGKKVKVG